MIQSYVISLESEIKRREHIVKQFNKHKTNFQFFNAVTPKTSSKEIQLLGLKDTQFVSLSPGELACFLSHLKLWNLAVQEKMEYIAIFEDDIHLGEDFEKLLNESMWLTGLDIVKLEKFRSTVELSFSSKRIEGLKRRLYILKGKNLGTGGYILSQKGAKYLLDYVKNLGTAEAIDAVIFNQRKYPKVLPIYQLEPAVVIQDTKLNRESLGLESSLESSRNKNKRQELVNNKITHKLKKELVRLGRSFAKRKSHFT